MSNQYVLLGGKDPQNSKNFELEKKILERIGLIKPHILWIGLANRKHRNEKRKEFEEIKKIYPCSIKELVDVEDEEVMAWADVFYFCGGSADHLIKTVRGTRLEEFIKNSSNKIMMGISAGAMLFCKAGMGDGHAYLDKGHMHQYQMVDGIGILNLSMCPHYNHDGLDCYNDVVNQYFCDGIALEDDTAVLISDCFTVFKTNMSRSVYFFDSKKDYLMVPLYEK